MIYELLFVKLKFVADEFQKDTKVGAFTTIIRNVVQIGSSQVNTVSTLVLLNIGPGALNPCNPLYPSEEWVNTAQNFI